MKAMRILWLGVVVSLASSCALFEKSTAVSVGFPSIEAKGISASQRRLLSMAKQDFSDVDGGNIPTHARKTAVARDGGTTTYDGEGYSLVAHRSYENRNGVMGRIVGPTITLRPKIIGGKAVSIDASRFQPLAKATQAE